MFCIKIRIYKTIILPVVVYWSEIWCLTLRDESRLSVFEIGAEGDSWTEEERGGLRLEKTTKSA
jgi:hypothetical protein